MFADSVPNWISAKSKEELRALQLEDSNIAVILKSKEMNQKPSKEVINTYNQDIKNLSTSGMP